MSAAAPSLPGVSPTYFGQDVYHFTTTEGRLLGEPGTHARLFNVNVNTALAGCQVYVYDGVSSMSGKLVAKIDASAVQSYWFGGVRCPSGIYVLVTGSGTPDITVGLDAQPLGGELTLSGNEITEATRVASTQGDGLAQPYALTLSGNEVTDATRSTVLTTASTGNMMDGQTVPDSSYGIRRAATNLFRRGQCDAATDWTATGGGATSSSIDATVAPPFSTQSIKAVTDGLAASQGLHPCSATGLAAAAGTVGVGSIYFKGVAGQAYQHAMRWTNSDASATEGTFTSFNATGSWQLLTATSLAVAVGKTGDKLGIRVFVNGTRAETFWVAHAMLESGQAVVAPYVATSGGATATHAAGRVQAPAALVGASQGWWAARVRMGYSDTQAAALTFSPRIATWDNDTNNRLLLLYDRVNKKFVLQSQIGGGAFAAAQSAAVTFNAGDIFTVIGRWDGTTVKVSVNGAAFVSASSAGSWPALVSPSFDIGNEVGNNTFDGDILWFASGTGTLADTDAAAMNSADPRFLSDLPGQPTLLWECNSPSIHPTFETSTGIWEGTTNLITNGGFETNINNWSNAAGTGGPIVRSTTDSKFGAACGSYPCPGSAIGEGPAFNSVPTATATAFTASAWVKATAGTVLRLVVRERDATDTFLRDTNALFTASGGWDRVTNTVTTGVSTTQSRLCVTTNTAVAVTILIDGAQLEQKSFATPYVETNGATASRLGATVKAPIASVPPVTQGWFAVRMRMGFPSSNTTASVAALDINDGTASNRLGLIWSGATTTWQSRRIVSLAGGIALTVGDSFAVGDLRTLVLAWDTINEYISVSGAAFSSQANANLPIGVSEADIGSVRGGSQMDCDFLWVAFGSGTLSTAGLATMNAWGNTDPALSWFPTAANVTMIWHGAGSQYITP